MLWRRWRKKTRRTWPSSERLEWSSSTRRRRRKTRRTCCCRYRWWGERWRTERTKTRTRKNRSLSWSCCRDRWSYHGSCLRRREGQHVATRRRRRRESDGRISGKAREKEEKRTLTSLRPVLPVPTPLTPDHPSVLIDIERALVQVVHRTSVNIVGALRSAGEGTTRTTRGAGAVDGGEGGEGEEGGEREEEELHLERVGERVRRPARRRERTRDWEEKTEEG